jgi:hypothetical protein
MNNINEPKENLTDAILEITKVLTDLTTEVEKLKSEAKCINCVSHTPKNIIN